jgi:hypothetical protein
MRAFCCEQFGGGTPDAPRTSRDNGHFILQPQKRALKVRPYVAGMPAYRTTVS